MSTEEFNEINFDSVQKDYFLNRLPLLQKGQYFFGKKGLDAPRNTIVLFQYDNAVIASAIFLEQGKEKEYKYMQFDIDSIKVFEPVGAEVFKKLWPEFKMFSNVKQELSYKHYAEFEMQLEQVCYPSLEITNKHFEKQIQDAQKRSTESRKMRIANSPRIPSKVEVYTTAFTRNADVVAEVLVRAHGICEKCKNTAPFLRRSDGKPYLEVHHKIRLADGGEDTVDNAIALCPNCHRELHYGLGSV